MPILDPTQAPRLPRHSNGTSETVGNAYAPAPALRSNRVGGGTEIALRHVTNANSLAGGIGHIPPGPQRWAGRTHSVSATCPSVHHLQIATSRYARRLDRVPWLRMGQDQRASISRARPTRWYVLWECGAK
jgi:hypothetical protein